MPFDSYFELWAWDGTLEGIKRHILTNHKGLLLAAIIHEASVQDRDGAALVLTRQVRRRFAFIQTIVADAGYQGPRAAEAARRSGR
jgi:putative transposase